MSEIPVRALNDRDWYRGVDKTGINTMIMVGFHDMADRVT